MPRVPQRPAARRPAETAGTAACASTALSSTASSPNDVRSKSSGATNLATDVATGARPASGSRAWYATPRLEALGGWSMMTLQQSIPVGPGGF